MSAATIVGALRSRGMTSIVCEGGPSLAAQLLRERQVDELCLTTSPRVGGAQHPLSMGSIEVTLGRLAVDDSGVVFARWSVPRG